MNAICELMILFGNVLVSPKEIYRIVLPMTTHSDTSEPELEEIRRILLRAFITNSPACLLADLGINARYNLHLIQVEGTTRMRVLVRTRTNTATLSGWTPKLNFTPRPQRKTAQCVVMISAQSDPMAHPGEPLITLQFHKAIKGLPRVHMS